MPKSVLVADSDIGFRNRICKILSAIGSKVESVLDTNEVINRLQIEKPNLLILSEGFSQETAFKDLENIRKLALETKIVFLTKNDPDINIKAKAHCLGISLIIKKDFSTHFMLKKILELLKDPTEKMLSNKYDNGVKILIIDDVSEIRGFLTAFFRINGFASKVAVNGDEGLAQIKNEKPNLVFLDENMPGMDGLTVLKKIKEIDSTIKVVMMTGAQGDDLMDEAIVFGVSDCIGKPFDLEKLEVLILSILILEQYK